VTLAEMKADPRLADLALIRQSRLSVVPVSDAHWGIIAELAGV
jgi:predicted RNA-binding protein with PUA-like domain